MNKLLEDYVFLIRDTEIKEDVYRLLDEPEVQSAFKQKSSSTGQYHPEDEIREWGLLVHTLRVCAVAIQIHRSFGYDSLAMDIIIASSLLHDVPYKLKEDGFTDKNHARNNAGWFFQNTKLTGEKRQRITSCIYNHMGKWGVFNPIESDQFPVTQECWSVHLADNIASRKNIKVDPTQVEYLRSNL